MSGLRIRLAAALVAVALPVSACGAGEATVDISPLSARLVQIDRSVAGGQFDQARSDLSALAAATKAARATGELSSPQADAILDAVIALRAALPAPESTSGPTPTPTPSATPTSRPSTTTSAPTGDAPKGAAEKGKGGAKGKKRGRK